MTEIYRSTKTWSLITIAGFAFLCFFHMITILIGLAQVASPEMVVDLDGESPMSAWYLIYGLVSLVHIPVLIATIVFFLVWLNRSHKNLLALRPTFLKFSSGWAVGWWFIPFANLVKPFQVVREVWWESDPEIPSDPMFLTESLHSAPTYMGFWWAFWLLANFVTNIVDKLFDPDRTDNVVLVGAGFILASTLMITAAILAINVVRDITSRQAARFVAAQSLDAQAAAVSEENQNPGPEWRR